MFTLEGKLTFINIDQNYLRKLHDACSEVYYKLLSCMTSRWKPEKWLSSVVILRL